MSLFHPRGRIDRYVLEGAASVEEERRLRAHLRGCARCRGHYDAAILALRAASGDVAGFGRGEQERLLTLVTGEAQAARARKSDGERSARTMAHAPWWTGVLPDRAFVPAAAGFALVAIAGLFLLLRTPSAGVVDVVGGALTADGEPLSAGDTLPAGVILSAEKGDSVLALDGEKVVLLREGSGLFVEGGAARSVILTRGRARFSVEHANGDNPFTVRAGDAQVDVKGTLFVVQRMSDSDTLIAVQEGRVAVKGGKGTVELGALEETHVRRGAVLPARRASAQSLDDDVAFDLLKPIRKLKRAGEQLLDELDGSLRR